MQLSNVSIISTAITEVGRSSYKSEDEALILAEVTMPELWLLADFSPTIISARNLPTEMLNKAEPPEIYDDYGYKVEFVFDQVVRNSVDYPDNFILEDAEGAIWYGQTAEISNQYSKKVIIPFGNFNNAVNPVTALVITGNLSNGYVLLTASEFEFEAGNLVPVAVPGPEPIEIWDVDNNTIKITFDGPILEILSQIGFSISAMEPDTSPEGELSEVEYVVDEIAHAEVERLATVALEQGSFNQVVYSEGVIKLEVDG